MCCVDFHTYAVLVGVAPLLLLVYIIFGIIDLGGQSTGV